MIQALLAALLFGASTPAAKLLLGEIEPVPLSALLYLGSGLGLLTTQAMRRLNGGPTTEAPLDRRDLPWLIGAVMAGGVAAPSCCFSACALPRRDGIVVADFRGRQRCWRRWCFERPSVGGCGWPSRRLRRPAWC